MPLPERNPRDIGRTRRGADLLLPNPVQAGVSSWVNEGACLTCAIDDIIAAPASRVKAATATFCFALHAEAAPGMLLTWLQHNVLWQDRELQWTYSHHIHNSTPENNTGMPLPTDSVALACAELHAESGEYASVENSIGQALAEAFASPVECYITCPGCVPLFSGGLDELKASSADEAVECVRQHGVAVLEGCMEEAMLRLWQQQVQKQVALLERRLEARSISVEDNSIFTFREIAARGKHRFDARLDTGPLWQDQPAEALRSYLQEAPWVPVVHALLGEDVETITSVVYSRPGADAQEWHSDGPPSAAAEEPYALCAFVPLVGMTQSTGCTQFWPGSHPHQHLLGFGPAAEVLETAVDGLVRAGDAVLYDYRTLHRGLPNRCESGQRDVLQVVYHTKDYREQRNYSVNRLIDE